MRRLSPFLPGLVAIIVGIGGLLYGCQETPEPTSPQFARVRKGLQTLTVTGGGTGSGQVTAPEVGDDAPLACKIIAGTAQDGCTKVYPWRSSVTLTATADQGNTFTGWTGACSGTAPCKVLLNQSRNVKANFSGSGVPSFTLTVTGAGTGSGSVKSQTGLSPAINCTVTSGTATGSCSARYPSPTSVTLTATIVEGSFGGWSGDCSAQPCTLSMTADREVTATFTAPPRPEASVGKWDPPVSTPIIGLHLTHLLNGKALLWGHGGQPHTWNPDGGGFTQVTNSTCTDPAACELFCSGHTFLSDGRLLVAGGHNELLGNNYGLKQASIFNGTSWTATGSMTYARWYPTLIELENGGVVALAGTQEPGLHASIPERYNGSTWTALSTAQLELPVYPRAFLEPKNGWIYYAGAGIPRYLNPSGTGTWSSAPARVVGDRNYGSAVMLDRKVLYVGGGGRSCPALPQNTAEIVDLSAANPTWSPTGSMAFRRRQTNATILPDRKVLVTGGTSACGSTSEAGAVFAAEVWDPTTGQWSTWANASVVRVYHSTTLLLPDGRVLSTGSGDGGGVSQQYTYEIFSPPYLFNGARPTYSLASTTMGYGQPFTVQTPDAASIRRVTIIRLASTTHAFDQGQRLNTLAFQAAADGLSLTVTPPPSGRIAPPGPYMLFILNDKGVPSIAKTVLLSQ
jgi:hypothetical protein